MRIMHMTFEDGGETFERMVEWPPCSMESFMVHLMEEVEAGHRITMRMEECT